MLTLAERPLKIEVVVDPARATMAAPAQPQKQNPSGAGKSARAAKRHAKAKRRKEARPTKTLEDLDAEMEGMCATRLPQTTPSRRAPRPSRCRTRPVRRR